MSLLVKAEGGGETDWLRDGEGGMRDVPMNVISRLREGALFDCTG